MFDGLPLGTPEVAAAVDELTADRFRTVLAVLCTVTIEPCGRGKRRMVDGLVPGSDHRGVEGVKLAPMRAQRLSRVE